MKAILLFFLLATLPPQAQVEPAIPVAWAIVRYFPAEEQPWAMRTAYCENRTFDPEAISPTADYGIFQINKVHAVSYDWSRILETDYNVAMAADLQRTSGWGIWTTYGMFCQ